jgi:predicted short-subunit dehydrogenase-like oxidoreductase (DUF2520 family)
VSTPPSVRVVGAGRAGRSLAAALEEVGWPVEPMPGRDDDVRAAAAGVDLLVIATPDAAIAAVARAVEPSDAVVAHLAGSLGPDVLWPHPRRAAIHPLVSMPNPQIGARRLRAGGWFGIAGDPMASRVVDALGGRPIEVADEQRAAYHAAGCIASNHVVALLGQVERVAAPLGLPVDVYLDLVRGSVESVAELGPAAALTGPAARGDWATIDRHLAALDPDERSSYREMVRLARKLAGSGDG